MMDGDLERLRRIAQGVNSDPEEEIVIPTDSPCGQCRTSLRSDEPVCWRCGWRRASSLDNSANVAAHSAKDSEA